MALSSTRRTPSKAPLPKEVGTGPVGSGRGFEPFTSAGDISGALASRVRPTSSRRDRLLPLPAPLTALIPNGGLQRGTVVAIETAVPPRTDGACPGATGAGGATTLAFSLLSAASTTGSWCAAVGVASPGAVAMAELGVDLDHLALVPRPGHAWAEVTAVLVDGMDIVLTLPPWPARLQLAHRLTARARERQAVLIVMGPQAWWPEGPDVRLSVTSGAWEGVGTGHGYLQGRRVEVVASGRRVAARPVRAGLWLPARSGAPAPA